MSVVQLRKKVPSCIRHSFLRDEACILLEGCPLLFVVEAVLSLLYSSHHIFSIVANFVIFCSGHFLLGSCFLSPRSRNRV
jgi:hypothetical protein